RRGSRRSRSTPPASPPGPSRSTSTSCALLKIKILHYYNRFNRKSGNASILLKPPRPLLPSPEGLKPWTLLEGSSTTAPPPSQKQVPPFERPHELFQRQGSGPRRRARLRGDRAHDRTADRRSRRLRSAARAPACPPANGRSVRLLRSFRAGGLS